LRSGPRRRLAARVVPTATGTLPTRTLPTRTLPTGTLPTGTLAAGTLAARAARTEAAAGSTGPEAAAARTHAPASAGLPMRVVPHHALATAAVVMSPTVVSAACVGAEHEAGEEDRADDEHHARDDSHPSGHGVEPRPARWFFADDGRFARGFRGDRVGFSF
jgi:hypothetical protein